MIKKGSKKESDSLSSKKAKLKQSTSDNISKNLDPNLKLSTPGPTLVDDGKQVLVTASDLNVLREAGMIPSDCLNSVWAFLNSEPRDMSILEQDLKRNLLASSYASKKAVLMYNKLQEESKQVGRKKMKNTRFDPSLQDPHVLQKSVDGTILFTIKGAQSLANTDTVGVSDPYCVLRTTFSTLIHYKTKIIKNSLNPRWDQTFKFDVKQRNATGDFHINVFDHDTIGKDDWLGVVVIPLYNVVDAPREVGLQGRLPFNQETKKKKKDQPQAQIIVEIKYIPNVKQEKCVTGPIELINKGSLTTITTEDDFQKDYEFIKVLGTGATAEVKLAKVLKENDKYVAVKIVDKSSEMWTDEETAEKFRREVEIMNVVKSCENLIGSIDIRETDIFVYIVMELAEFELFDYIMNREDQHCSVEFTAKIMFHILKGIEYLHDHFICHRDLKPENVLLSFGTDKSAKFPISVKVSDYGESIMFSEKKPNIKGFVGTPPYMAPEIVDDSVSKYTKAIDMWAAGVLCHATLVGYLPYDGDTDAETYQLILEGDLQFPSPEWDGVDCLAQAFVTSCLTYDFKKRMDVKEALKHPWITKHSKLY